MKIALFFNHSVMKNGYFSENFLLMLSCHVSHLDHPVHVNESFNINCTVRSGVCFFLLMMAVSLSRTMLNSSC
jgi:hypothetical protein